MHCTRHILFAVQTCPGTGLVQPTAASTHQDGISRGARQTRSNPSQHRAHRKCINNTGSPRKTYKQYLPAAGGTAIHIQTESITLGTKAHQPLHRGQLRSASQTQALQAEQAKQASNPYSPAPLNQSTYTIPEYPKAYVLSPLPPSTLYPTSSILHLTRAQPQHCLRMPPTWRLQPLKSLTARNRRAEQHGGQNRTAHPSTMAMSCRHTRPVAAADTQGHLCCTADS